MDDERHLDDEPRGESIVDWLLDRPDVTSRLRREPPDRVLVLGCGDGEQVEQLATTFPNVSVYGIDDDHERLEQATARLARSRVRDRVLCRQGSMWFPQMTATFDVVIAVGLLSGSGDDPVSTRELIATLGSVLGDEGLAVLDTPADLATDEASDAGFYRVERLGRSERGFPVYLLRR